MEAIAHQNTLLIEENRMIRKANEALSKRRRAKKARICHGDVLTGEDVSDVLAQKEIEEQLARDIRRNGITTGRGGRLHSDVVNAVSPGIIHEHARSK